jgi:hypothetical protein
MLHHAFQGGTITCIAVCGHCNPGSSASISLVQADIARMLDAGVIVQLNLNP